MKIALTGADGMLGQAIRRVFTGHDLVCFNRADLDITDLDRTVDVIRTATPEAVIHAAALTDVDRCEREPEAAYLINGIGTRNVTVACEKVGCPILYLSTDYVFDGEKESPYDEWDTPNPINHYGRSKLLGERYASSLTNRYYIVRTSWLYGAGGNNFVDTIAGLLSRQDRISVVTDQTGSPTYTVDLAATLREIITRGYGVYHATNSGACSWHEFASEIARLRNSSATIEPATAEALGRPARRPRNSVLNRTMLRLEKIPEPRHWKDALGEYFSALT